MSSFFSHFGMALKLPYHQYFQGGAPQHHQSSPRPPATPSSRLAANLAGTHVIALFLELAYADVSIGDESCRRYAESLLNTYGDCAILPSIPMLLRHRESEALLALRQVYCQRRDDALKAQRKREKEERRRAKALKKAARAEKRNSMKNGNANISSAAEKDAADEGAGEEGDHHDAAAAADAIAAEAAENRRSQLIADVFYPQQFKNSSKPIRFVCSNDADGGDAAGGGNTDASTATAAEHGGPTDANANADADAPYIYLPLPPQPTLPQLHLSEMFLRVENLLYAVVELYWLRSVLVRSPDILIHFPKSIYAIRRMVMGSRSNNFLYHEHTRLVERILAVVEKIAAFAGPMEEFYSLSDHQRTSSSSGASSSSSSTSNQFRLLKSLMGDLIERLLSAAIELSTFAVADTSGGAFSVGVWNATSHHATTAGAGATGEDNNLPVIFRQLFAAVLGEEARGVVNAPFATAATTSTIATTITSGAGDDSQRQQAEGPHQCDGDGADSMVISGRDDDTRPPPLPPATAAALSSSSMGMGSSSTAVTTASASASAAIAAACEVPLTPITAEIMAEKASAAKTVAQRNVEEARRLLDALAERKKMNANNEDCATNNTNNNASAANTAADGDGDDDDDADGERRRDGRSLVLTLRDGTQQPTPPVAEQQHVPAAAAAAAVNNPFVQMPQHHHGRVTSQPPPPITACAAYIHTLMSDAAAALALLSESGNGSGVDDQQSLSSLSLSSSLGCFFGVASSPSPSLSFAPNLNPSYFAYYQQSVTPQLSVFLSLMHARAAEGTKGMKELLAAHSRRRQQREEKEEGKEEEEGGHAAEQQQGGSANALGDAAGSAHHHTHHTHHTADAAGNGEDDGDATLRDLLDQLPPAAVGFLRTFCNLCDASLLFEEKKTGFGCCHTTNHRVTAAAREEAAAVAALRRAGNNTNTNTLPLPAHSINSSASGGGVGYSHVLLPSSYPATQLSSSARADDDHRHRASISVGGAASPSPRADTTSNVTATTTTTTTTQPPLLPIPIPLRAISHRLGSPATLALLVSISGIGLDLHKTGCSMAALSNAYGAFSADKQRWWDQFAGRSSGSGESSGPSARKKRKQKRARTASPPSTTCDATQQRNDLLLPPPPPLPPPRAPGAVVIAPTPPPHHQHHQHGGGQQRYEEAPHPKAKKKRVEWHHSTLEKEEQGELLAGGEEADCDDNVTINTIVTSVAPAVTSADGGEGEEKAVNVMNEEAPPPARRKKRAARRHLSTPLHQQPPLYMQQLWALQQQQKKKNTKKRSSQNGGGGGGVALSATLLPGMVPSSAVAATVADPFSLEQFYSQRSQKSDADMRGNGTRSDGAEGNGDSDAVPPPLRRESTPPPPSVAVAALPPKSTSASTTSSNLVAAVITRSLGLKRAQREEEEAYANASLGDSVSYIGGSGGGSARASAVLAERASTCVDVALTPQRLPSDRQQLKKRANVMIKGGGGVYEEDDRHDAEVARLVGLATATAAAATLPPAATTAETTASATNAPVDSMKGIAAKGTGDVSSSASPTRTAPATAVSANDAEKAVRVASSTAHHHHPLVDAGDVVAVANEAEVLPKGASDGADGGDAGKEEEKEEEEDTRDFRTILRERFPSLAISSSGPFEPYPIAFRLSSCGEYFKRSRRAERDLPPCGPFVPYRPFPPREPPTAEGLEYFRK